MKIELIQFKPCKSALEFRKKHTSFKDAWDNCQRGDWMLWIAQKVGVHTRPLTYTKALCAETIIHLMKDQRNIDAIKIAKKFGKYKANKNELDAAAYAAAAAYSSADASATIATAHFTAHSSATIATAYSAYSVTSAAYSAYSVTCFTAHSAYFTAHSSADATCFTAHSVTSATAKLNNRKQTADICRKHLTKLVLNKIKQYE